MDPSTKKLVKLSAVVAAVSAVFGLAPIVGAVDDPTDGRSGSRSTPDYTVRPSEETKKARHEVDVLTASRSEIEKKLGALNRDYQNQESALAAARRAVDEARAKVDEARRRVADAEKEAEAARQVVLGYAIEAYVHPPSIASIGVLSISDTQEAGFANEVLTIMADERRKVVEDFEVKKKIAAMEQDLADQAVAEAEQRSAEVEDELARLTDMRAEQAGFMADMDDRLGNALAEAAALEEIDEQAARELAEQEMELRASEQAARLAAATSPPTPQLISTRTGSTNGSGTMTSGPSTTGPGAPPTTARPPSPTTTRPPSPTTTVKPPSPPSGVVTWSDVVSVGGGIWVHRSIEANARAMLNAATAAGFSLTGGGYRDSASQIATRMANCGTSYYDIYEKPSGQCSPPTAIPGRSMHERGLAMDLQSNGVLITSRSNPAFIWLSNNAARYGFYNLPSEPWHWSTNGH